MVFRVSPVEKLENSGTQNYSGTKLGLIRVPWLFLLQLVRPANCMLSLFACSEAYEFG